MKPANTELCMNVIFPLNASKQCYTKDLKCHIVTLILLGVNK